jgi:hypothetical protein
MSGSDSTYVPTFGDGGTVLERVLLAIINAHTDAESKGQQRERLNTAMTALIGPATARERDMERALQYMVRQRQRDACDLEMNALGSCGDACPQAARSVPELATVAARKILNCTHASDIQATARVLGKMFNTHGNAYGVEPDHIRDELEAEAVRQILGELAEWDTPSTCPN